jgi:hypothetical protein
MNREVAGSRRHPQPPCLQQQADQVSGRLGFRRDHGHQPHTGIQARPPTRPQLTSQNLYWLSARRQAGCCPRAADYPNDLVEGG